MAKLVEVYRSEDQKLSKRQLPLFIDENLTMVMDLSGLGLIVNNPSIRAKEVDKFLDMYGYLTPTEVKEAFTVDCKDFFSTLSQAIPCVGCRRSAERLYEQLRKSGHPALEPLVITPDGCVTVKDDHFTWPRLLGSLLHGHSARLDQLVESQIRSKKYRRCVLHSLDYQRVRCPWREVWEVMRPQCREEVLLIDTSTLMVTLEGYLQKHRFCTECRTKVLRAYWLLVEEPEPLREKGYIPALYAGIKRCLPDKHIHLPTNDDYITTLVGRVQPDIMGSGERHAKTLEVAQGEVITCLGLCVYERLHRIQMRLREEEATCQVLAAVAIDALSRKFQISVESKRGVSNLELLYNQFTQEEMVKQQRKEQKKLKRKRRKERKAGADSAGPGLLVEDQAVDDDATPFDETDGETHDSSLPLEEELINPVVLKQMANGSNSLDSFCVNCGLNEKAIHSPGKKSRANNSSPGNTSETQTSKTTNSNCGLCKKSKKKTLISREQILCEYSQDCGYSSGNNNASSSTASSPEGSEVACCEEFCTDEGVCSKKGPKLESSTNKGFMLSLVEMLEDSTSSDEESFIPIEDVREFQSRHNILQKREELRQSLRMKFDQMCITNAGQGLSFGNNLETRFK